MCKYVKSHLLLPTILFVADIDMILPVCGEKATVYCLGSIMSFFLEACKFTCCTVLDTAEKAPEAAKHSTPVIVARKTAIIEPI